MAGSKGSNDIQAGDDIEQWIEESNKSNMNESEELERPTDTNETADETSKSQHGSNTKDEITTADRDGEEEYGLSYLWGCDAICTRRFDYPDGLNHCRYCNIDFCNDCHKLLLEDRLGQNICGKEHAFLTVPYVTADQVFKEGELLVGGKVMSLDDWKKSLRKQYDL